MLSLVMTLSTRTSGLPDRRDCLVVHEGPLPELEAEQRPELGAVVRAGLVLLEEPVDRGRLEVGAGSGGDVGEGVVGEGPQLGAPPGCDRDPEAHLRPVEGRVAGPAPAPLPQKPLAGSGP